MALDNGPEGVDRRPPAVAAMESREPQTLRESYKLPNISNWQTSLVQPFGYPFSPISLIIWSARHEARFLMPENKCVD